MNCIIRNAQMSDYDSVVRILNQGQALHINWRPDIYKPNDALLPKAVFEEIVKGDTFYIAENEGNVIGILELIFRHIESPAQVTRDIVFIDTMAVDEPYRGMGVGHLFFEKVKERLIWKQTKLEDSMQPPLKAPFPKPDNREQFWSDFENKSFEYVAKKYGGIGLKNDAKLLLRKIKRKIKKLVVKGGKRDSSTI